MIKDKTELQKTQQPIEQQPVQPISVDGIGRSTQPLNARQITGGITPISAKITADAPYTNDGYIEVLIAGQKVRLMTTA